MKHHTDKTPSVRPVSGRSVWGMVWFRFRKNKLAMAGLFLLLLMMLAILAAPLYVPYEQVVKQNIVDKFTPPCAEYWFGTDQFGRDLFARIVYGGRISLFMALPWWRISFVAGCALEARRGISAARSTPSSCAS